jgi:hypothetical protein
MSLRFLEVPPHARPAKYGTPWEAARTGSARAAALSRQARKIRFAARSAEAIAVFTSSRPVQ